MNEQVRPASTCEANVDLYFSLRRQRDQWRTAYCTMGRDRCTTTTVKRICASRSRQSFRNSTPRHARLPRQTSRCRCRLEPKRQRRHESNRTIARAASRQASSRIRSTHGSLFSMRRRRVGFRAAARGVAADAARWPADLVRDGVPVRTHRVAAIPVWRDERFEQRWRARGAVNAGALVPAAELTVGQGRSAHSANSTRRSERTAPGRPRRQ